MKMNVSISAYEPDRQEISGAGPRMLPQQNKCRHHRTNPLSSISHGYLVYICMPRQSHVDLDHCHLRAGTCRHLHPRCRLRPRKCPRSCKSRQTVLLGRERDKGGGGKVVGPRKICLAPCLNENKIPTKTISTCMISCACTYMKVGA